MSFLSDNMPDPYKRVSRALGTSLVLGDADAWAGFTVVLSARLSKEERAALAWSALRSLSPQHAIAAYHAAILPEPKTAMEKAAAEYRARRSQVVRISPAWTTAKSNRTAIDLSLVDNATPAQIDGYCVACFNRMPPHRQAQFLDYASRVTA